MSKRAGLRDLEMDSENEHRSKQARIVRRVSEAWSKATKVRTYPFVMSKMCECDTCDRFSGGFFWWFF